MKSIFFCLLLISGTAAAQKTYKDSMQQYQASYVAHHEVVKENDKKAIQFFPVQQRFRVIATVEKKENSPWFTMASSGPIKNMYRVYAVAHFNIGDTTVALHLYQSQSLMQTEHYRDHLFIPFTDATSGQETYYGGRYMDVNTSDIQQGRIVLDFNKAYNPYCVYVSGVYSCPIPPKENHLPVAIKAGEKDFAPAH